MIERTVRSFLDIELFESIKEEEETDKEELEQVAREFLSGE